MAISDYIYSITGRPRDVIAFFNACIGAASNHSRLGARELRLAEGEYSRKRLSAIGDEWSADYPTLIDFAAILQRRSASFKVETILDVDVAELCLTIAADNPGGIGLTQSAMQVIDGLMSTKHFKLLLVRTFYQVGLVGLKISPHETESWADELGKSVSFPEINDQTSVVVHPAYRRALGVRE
ncbi:MAG TPA: hypothetical protein VGZ27_01595 [Vicinamibacterales bacterium]|jgi:hypothetical protein|nr:hypothetical protein [Vicinamibacterales bacterium]